MRQLVDHSTFAHRSVVLLVAGFATFGLVLASLGMYAVISYSVAQRRQELGIRLALGVAPRDLQMRILAETVWLVLLGLAAGLPASWMAGRAIRGLLYDVASWDPTTFLAVLGVLVAVAMLAGYAPARRATRIDPMTALQVD